MIEDLYTDKFTIRQVRQSHTPLSIRVICESIKKQGGPGIKEEKNYLICPSTAFCTIVYPQLASTLADPMEQVNLHQCIHEYCRRYPLTMLIMD